MKTVSLKLTPTEYQALVDLVKLGRYVSVSDAIRDGIGMLFHSHNLKHDARQDIRLERIRHARRKAKKGAYGETVEVPIPLGPEPTTSSARSSSGPGRSAARQPHP